MTALIFGANGQDGYYLQQLLTAQGLQAIGVSRSGNHIHADVADYAAVAGLVQQYHPGYIFHFAANSTPRHEALFENHATISTGTLNVLEAVRLHAPGCKVFISGSALQFRNEGKPINETAPFDARDAYSVSRIQSVYAARYFRTLGVQTYVGYFFNHDSPLRSERHMSMKIAAAAHRIAAGSGETLRIGNVSVAKEWTFAGDSVAAVWTLMQQDAISESVIGSGLAYTIEEWLEACFSYAGLNWRDHVAVEENFVPDYQRLVSDPATLHQLGWQPAVSFPQLAAMMMQSLP